MIAFSVESLREYPRTITGIPDTDNIIFRFDKNFGQGHGLRPRAQRKRISTPCHCFTARTLVILSDQRFRNTNSCLRLISFYILPLTHPYISPWFFTDSVPSSSQIDLVLSRPMWRFSVGSTDFTTKTSYLLVDSFHMRRKILFLLVDDLKNLGEHGYGLSNVSKGSLWPESRNGREVGKVEKIVAVSCSTMTELSTIWVFSFNVFCVVIWALGCLKTFSFV